jgi:hypothetical protein
MFGLYGFHGHIGSSFTFENEDISQRETSTEQRRFVFKEELAVRTRGAIVHPDLISFSVGGLVGGVQDELRTTGVGPKITQSGDDFLYGYDGQLALLRHLPYNLDLFASRAETNVRRDFVGRTKVKAERFGTTIRARGIPLPSSVTVEEQRLRQRLVGEQTQQDETRRLVIYEGRRRGDLADLNVTYRFEDVDDRIREGGNFRLHTGGLNHVWRLSPDRKRVLFSTARVFARRGDLDSTTVTDTESLRWQLTPSLWSDYNYSFSYADRDVSTVTSNRASIGLGHQWYQSLTTSLHAEAVFVDFDRGNETDYGGGIAWAYTKRIPRNGRFGLNLAFSYLLTDRDVPTGLVSVFDEQHTFTNARPVILKNRDVVASTIVVTDESRSVVYARRVDYFIEQLGGRTEIRRNPLGSIDAGNIIFVSYDSEIGGPFRIGNRPVSFGSSLDFGWVRTFYAGERLRQDVFEGDPDVTLGSIDNDTAGIEFRRRHDVLELAAGTEYRRYRSDELRFDSIGFTQTAFWRISRSLGLELLGNEVFHDFEEPDRSRDFYSGRASVSWRPWRNVIAGAFAGVRSAEETDIPTETFTEAGADVTWIFGQFSVDLSYEHDARDQGESERTGDLLRLEVRRSF